MFAAPGNAVAITVAGAFAVACASVDVTDREETAVRPQ
jgi:hypothetical protein